MSTFYYIALLLLPSVAATADEADAVAVACNLTLYFDVCVSSLRSDPRSRGADLRGLVGISIDLSVAHAKGTAAQLRRMKAESTAAGGRGKKIALGIDDCLEEYRDAVDDLRESVAALARADYDTLNAMVSAAMSNADSCEGGFEERTGIAAPPGGLKESNLYFCMLCSISLAIAAQLA